MKRLTPEDFKAVTDQLTSYATWMEEWDLTLFANHEGRLSFHLSCIDVSDGDILFTWEYEDRYGDGQSVQRSISVEDVFCDAPLEGLIHRTEPTRIALANERALKAAQEAEHKAQLARLTEAQERETYARLKAKFEDKP